MNIKMWFFRFTHQQPEKFMNESFPVSFFGDAQGRRPRCFATTSAGRKQEKSFWNETPDNWPC